MIRGNRAVFNTHLAENGFNENRIATLTGAYKKLERWEIIKNKEVREMTKSEIVSLCQEGNNKIANRSYVSLQVMLDAVNYILKWADSEVKLSMTDFNIDEVLTKANDRFFTKQEIQDICDLFINPQDKFIVYGIFCGVYGKGYNDLLELKTENLDMENRLINTPSGKVIEMDEYLYDVLKDTIDRVWGGTYYKYIEDGNEGSTTDSYALNMESEYVLKPKPYSKNNDGLDPMKLNGIQRRLLKLSEYTETNLSGIDLLRSGIMYKMNLIEQETGKEWTCASLKEWFKENEIKGQVFEIYRTYKIKYKSEPKQSVS